MRIVVQRVSKARVTRQKDDSMVGQIEKGLFILVGFKKGDKKEDVENFAIKISKLRVMGDAEGKMNLSVNDADGKVLVVSQFTLYANTKGGNRPSFVDAEEPAKAKDLYELFIQKLKDNGVIVETGSFGDYMMIETVTDGPVTILYE